MILSVTGHRPTKLGGYGPNPLARAVAARMGAELDRLKPTRVISGMALGVDQWFAWLAVKRGIPFTAAIPFEGQELAWPEESRAKYRELIARAASVEYVSELSAADRAERYVVAKAMQDRNEWMVRSCHVLLAVWDGSKGGTANCLRYAEQVGREIVRVNPREMGT